MPTKIGFLLFPGFPMACLTSVIEPLRAANEISNAHMFEWILISEDAKKVISSAGIGFDPDVGLRDVGDLDYLILLSAPTARFTDRRSAAQLRLIDRHGTILGAISGGVFPLVRSGVVLKDRLSVHWCYEAAFAAEFPEIPRSDEVIEISTQRITASGAAAAFDVALNLIQTALGGDVADEVACWFQHPMLRKAGVRQTLPVRQAPDAALSPLVTRAIKLYAENLSNPATVAGIAAQLDITPRHLERSFKHATGQSPTVYFRHMRMKAARQIVMYTNDDISEIASAVGYANAKPFVRRYRAAFGLTPQEDRKRINLYRVEGN